MESDFACLKAHVLLAGKWAGRRNKAAQAIPSMQQTMQQVRTYLVIYMAGQQVWQRYHHQVLPTIWFGFAAMW